MDNLKFEELVKKAMATFNMSRDDAREYVAISEGLNGGDVIIVPDDMIDDEEDSDVVIQ